MRMLLVHPPLLSPAVWRRMEPLLATAGHRCAVPGLSLTPLSRWWQTAAASATGAMPDADFVVAHSGAGVLAPEIATRLPGLRAVVLVDAVLPALLGETAPAPELRHLVRTLARDGMLPPWPDWWSEADLAEVLPDPADRDALRADAPRLPAAFYDVAVPVVDGWQPPLAAYLQLSPAYREDRLEAERRGWRGAVVDGGHLDLLADPGRVTAELLALLS